MPRKQADVEKASATKAFKPVGDDGLSLGQYLGTFLRRAIIVCIQQNQYPSGITTLGCRQLQVPGKFLRAIQKPVP